MKNIQIKNKLCLMLLTVITLASCTPPEVGYISDNIHSSEDTIFVPRGVFSVASSPSTDQSTYPLKWEITGIKDASGNVTTLLNEEHEIKIWTDAFNGDIDTTLALAETKLKLEKNPTILINEVSGQLAFTQSSRYVRENDVFHIDVKASNVKGERQLNDFVVVKLEPFQAVEFPTEMRSRINLVEAEDETKSKILHTSVVKNNFDEAVPSVLDGTHPYITVTKISDEPKTGIQAKMIIADSYGNSLNPEKVTFYPSGSTYLQNYHDNSVETTSDNSSTTFMLPAPPFPQYSRSYSGTSSYLMYYLSTKDAFTVDTEAYEADYGSFDWSPYTDVNTGEVKNFAYIRWGIKINDTGTWELKMKIPYTKIKS